MPKPGSAPIDPYLALVGRLENDFTYHPPHGDQAQRYTELRAAGKELALAVAKRCPEGRERSVALTKIDEAIFWANAAIARCEPAPASQAPRA